MTDYYQMYPPLVANAEVTIDELKMMKSGDYPLRRVGDLTPERLSWPAIGSETGEVFDEYPELADSIARHGVLEPLEADERDGEMVLLDGHHRAVTLIEMDWGGSIPVYFYSRDKVNG